MIRLDEENLENIERYGNELATLLYHLEEMRNSCRNYVYHKKREAEVAGGNISEKAKEIIIQDRRNDWEEAAQRFLFHRAKAEKIVF